MSELVAESFEAMGEQMCDIYRFNGRERTCEAGEDDILCGTAALTEGLCS